MLLTERELIFRPPTRPNLICTPRTHCVCICRCIHSLPWIFTMNLLWIAVWICLWIGRICRMNQRKNFESAYESSYEPAAWMAVSPYKPTAWIHRMNRHTWISWIGTCWCSCAKLKEFPSIVKRYCNNDIVAMLALLQQSGIATIDGVAQSRQACRWQRTSCRALARSCWRSVR